MTVVHDGGRVALERVHPGGIFEGRAPDARRRSPTRSRSPTPTATRSRSRTPTASSPRSAPMDLHLIGEGRHEALYEALGAHVRELDGVAGVPSPSGRRPRARSASSASFNSWDGRLHPMRSLGVLRRLGAVPARRRAGCPLQVRDRHGRRRAAAQGRPAGRGGRGPAGHRLDRHRLDHEWGDGAWVERRGETEPLGEPMSIYEVHLGSWRREAGRLPRAGRRARRLRHRPRLHPRRAAAGHAAPVLRLLGLSGHRRTYAPYAALGHRPTTSSS